MPAEAEKLGSRVEGSALDPRDSFESPPAGGRLLSGGSRRVLSGIVSGSGPGVTGEGGVSGDHIPPSVPIQPGEGVGGGVL